MFPPVEAFEWAFAVAAEAGWTVGEWKGPRLNAWRGSHRRRVLRTEQKKLLIFNNFKIKLTHFIIFEFLSKIFEDNLFNFIIPKRMFSNKKKGGK